MRLIIKILGERYRITIDENQLRALKELRNSNTKVVFELELSKTLADKIKEKLISDFAI